MKLPRFRRARGAPLARAFGGVGRVQPESLRTTVRMFRFVFDEDEHESAAFMPVTKISCHVTQIFRRVSKIPDLGLRRLVFHANVGIRKALVKS